MPIGQIEVEESVGDDLSVTLRGDPKAIVEALVSGVGHEALIAFKDALEVEIAKRAKDRS